jgi:transcriptional regulator with XRE-family HTH domain
MAGTAFTKAFAAEVRHSRTMLHLSQEELADRADLHRNYVGMIERGQRTPTLLAIERIARGLKVKVSELIGRAEGRALRR